MESRGVRTGALRLHSAGFFRSGALSRFGHSGLADRAGCKPRFFEAGLLTARASSLRLRPPHRTDYRGKDDLPGRRIPK